MKTTFLQIV